MTDTEPTGGEYMLGRQPTPAELAANFERALTAVLAGEGLDTGDGLDRETRRALGAVMVAYPDVPADLIAAARASFAAQQDGSRAAAYHDELARRLADPTLGEPEI